MALGQGQFVEPPGCRDRLGELPPAAGSGVGQTRPRPRRAAPQRSTGDFGGESFGFGGNSEVDHEYLQEIGGILVADRLVYHERSRKISGAGGWLFSGSDRIHSAYATFSSAEFVERFVLSHSQREDRLVDALNENKSALGSFFAFFVEEPR